MAADGSRAARRLRGHPQEFRVSFARGGAWPRGTKGQTHYVQLGPRYRERVWGAIHPPGDVHEHLWCLEANDRSYCTFHPTLREAKATARRLLEPRPQPGT